MRAIVFSGRTRTSGMRAIHFSGRTRTSGITPLDFSGHTRTFGMRPLDFSGRTRTFSMRAPARAGHTRIPGRSRCLIQRPDARTSPLTVTPGLRDRSARSPEPLSVGCDQWSWTVKHRRFVRRVGPRLPASATRAPGSTILRLRRAEARASARACRRSAGPHPSAAPLRSSKGAGVERERRDARIEPAARARPRVGRCPVPRAAVFWMQSMVVDSRASAVRPPGGAPPPCFGHSSNGVDDPPAQESRGPCSGAGL